jgi:D-lactate dehydrogenase
MKPTVVLINTSRGGLVDAKALELALRKNKIGGLGMDVYENEQSYFFHDCSDDVFDDETLTGLLSHHNVIITAHQVTCWESPHDDLDVKGTQAEMGALRFGDHGTDKDIT